jgi:Periplasmic binding protein
VLCCSTVAAATALVAMGQGIEPTYGASSTPGVTAGKIEIGIPYVDLAAVRQQFGLNINQGSYPDAYSALIANVNAHGGINGRKIIPAFVPVNPAGTAAAATACTQLTEDTPVFVAISPLSPECYLEHGVPTINSTVTETLSSGAAANFTVTPPASAYDPLQLTALTRLGIFRGKKVGVFGGSITDKDEVRVVDTSLTQNHVRVVTTAINSAPTSDTAAAYQQQAVIAQRFKSEGVNEVVAVGSGSSTWPLGQQNNEATYNPSWVATNWNDLDGTVTGKGLQAKYLTNAVATTPTQSDSSMWLDPGIQQCVRIIRKAYPSDVIASPIGQSASDTSNDTYVAPVAACQNLAMFATIAKTAGKELTVTSFTHAGYGVKNARLPGSNATISFGPGRAYALGPVYLSRYRVSSGQFVIAPKPISK